MTYIMQLFFGFISTMGFAILFHVPRKNMIISCLIGGVGWMVYVYLRDEQGSAILGCFVAASLVGLFADVFSRVRKEPATVFIIPGIIPLVPGAGMFYTTQYLINGEFTQAAEKGTETLLMAGSISVGLMMMGAFFGMYSVIRHKLKN